eukprot:scaffold20856_cov138-Skeletonema_marinoi.AAC.2
MEEGAHVWLRSPKSEWGWLPARIVKKEIVPIQTKKHKVVETDLPKRAPSPRNNSDNKPKSAAVKALEEERRTALQSIMRNRSLEKEERKKQMDDVKAKFAKLTAEAEAEEVPAADGGGVASIEQPEEEKTKEPQLDETTVIQLTIVDDYSGLSDESSKTDIKSTISKTSGYGRGVSGFYANAETFSKLIQIDHIQAREEHPDIKLRNTPTSDSAAGIQFYGAQVNVMLSSSTNGTTTTHMPNPAVGQPATKINDEITGGVDDLIGLTHLHEPAILHALRLRYDADIIYTNTGPILLAINPFKTMEGVYGKNLMDLYRQEGQERSRGGTKQSEIMANPSLPQSQSSPAIPKTDQGGTIPAIYLYRSNGRLPPHVYKAADDAYRAMIRGIEMSSAMKRGARARNRAAGQKKDDDFEMPTNQSILVSGESGAGKTVTTKIVLNYFAMLSRKTQEDHGQVPDEGKTSIEQQVLQSNPILEAFGNARTIRNDNSSRFGKYINIAFSGQGQLLRASIDTYLLEKAATEDERNEFLLNGYKVQDFNLTNQSGTYDRRDHVVDTDMHKEMVEAMNNMGFGSDTVQQLMRLVVAVLFAGNMTFGERGDAAVLEENEASLAVAQLLGVSFDNLAASLTSKVIFARGDMIHKSLDVSQAEKANEALIKAIYGALFDFVGEKINNSINAGSKSSVSIPSMKRPVLGRTTSSMNIVPPGGASIGVLDIFGFETFKVNAFEQLCINYTNETLQQQFNKFVFKLEQQEYEREGILWKFIPFPDNQDVLDLIDKPGTGILQILDEQCIVDWGTDKKFSLSLYSKCDQGSNRFHASPSQRVRNQFAVEHYAGLVEYSTENWLEKNKDQLPAASAELLDSSEFELIGLIKKFVRYEGAKIAMKSLGRQFSDSLRVLRSRIDTTMPHYIRCLKPNDGLEPDNFDPKNIVEQLRYCGVLEAVRVSRAGYPTRYPHEVFVTRYFMICPHRNRDEGNLSPYHREISSNLTEEQKELKRIVSKIATEIWHLENVINKRSLKMETKQFDDRQENRNALAQPKTMDEFMKLDFASRCAVAGLQLGKTKVFLRREAFDTIESIRNEKFGKNVTKVAKYWRRYAAQKYLRTCRSAAIKIQCLFRRVEAVVRTTHLMKIMKEKRRKRKAATKIQAAYRNHYSLVYKEGAELRRKKAAIIKMQAIVRCGIARKRFGKLRHSLVILQCQVRMIKTRDEYRRRRAARIAFEKKQELAATKIQSIVRMKVVYVGFREQVKAASFIKRAYRRHLYQQSQLYGTFVKRYYVLGDPQDIRKKPKKQRNTLLARHRNALVNEKNQELTSLVNKLCLDLWQPGMFESFGKPEITKKQNGASASSCPQDQANGHASSAASKSRPPPCALPAFSSIPQNKEEFMARLDSSRRALTGMQMYDGVIFLRPETYSILEKLRNEIVGGSSSKIQAAARRKLAVSRYKKKRVAAIKIQSFARMKEAMRQLGPKRIERAATRIQSVYRMYRVKKRVWKQYWSTQSRDLFAYIQDDNWYMVEKMLHKNPMLVQETDPESGELPLHKIAEHASAWTLLIDMILTLYPKAVVHKDSSGALPIHHATKADNLTALEIIYESYRNGAKEADESGLFPIHVAAEHGSIECVKYLTTQNPESVHTLTSGGNSFPLHLACKNYSSVGVVTSLCRTTLKFSLASRQDENGELPLHLLLRCGEKADVVAVKTLLTCHMNAIAARDKNGDVPLHIALKHQCKPAVIETLLCHFPGSSVVIDGEGHSPLHLALSHSAADETNVSLISYAPQLVTVRDDATGKLPIQIATENELSLFIVYRLLKLDMPIDLKERVQVCLIPHHYSWNHILLEVGDRYYQVVSKILQQCTQPQVLALAHVEDSQGQIALANATPICRHEIRVMLRLFNTLELVKQRPAFTNAASDTEIFYALRYEPPPEQSNLFKTQYEQTDDDNDYRDDWDDDLSVMSDEKARKTSLEDANMSVAEKLSAIRNEKGQHVIAKITPRADIVERELKVRKDYNLSRHYVPSVISVHHTVHHGAYQNASADAAYCITMDGADCTVEHQMLDLRRAGKAFPSNELKRVAIALLHLHENGLVHTDFGPHSVGKFGPLWKLLGVGGCVPIGASTDPKHGIYHCPETIRIETVVIDGQERKTAKITSITASPAVDLWAFGHLVYESIVGAPLSAYSHRGKRVKSANLAKIARWDENSLKRALKHIDESDTLARDVVSKFLHPDPRQRYQSLRDAIADPFFHTDVGDRKIQQKNLRTLSSSIQR